MQLIEKFTKGKRADGASDDLIFVGDDFVAVIDGVSSKCDYKLDGKGTGQLGAELVYQALETLPAEANLGQILRSIEERFVTFYQRHPFPQDQRRCGPQAVMALYSRQRRCVYLIGDTQCLIDGQHYCRPKPSDLLLAQLRSLILAIFATEKQLQGPKELTAPELQAARSYIEDWILRSTCFANLPGQPFSYAVLDGQPVPESLVQTIALDAEAHELVLASDGYPVLCPSLKESELALAQLLEADPLCCQENPQTKGQQPGCLSFDDRSYIRLHIPTLA